MKVDEFLAHQQTAGVELTATVEPVAGKPDQVKITPYSAGGGCGCSRSFQISTNDIEDVAPTGATVWCCGKQMKTAKVTIRRSASLPIHDVLGMISTEQGSGDTHEDCVKGCLQGYWYCVKNHMGNCGAKQMACLQACPGGDPN